MNIGKTSKRPTASFAEIPIELKGLNGNEKVVNITLDEIQNLMSIDELMVEKFKKKEKKINGHIRKCPTQDCNGEGSLEIKRKTHRSLRNCQNQKKNLCLRDPPKAPKTTRRNKVEQIPTLTNSHSNLEIVTIKDLKILFQTPVNLAINYVPIQSLFSSNAGLFFEYLLSLLNQKALKNFDFENVLEQNTKRIDCLLNQNSQLKKQVKNYEEQILASKKIICENDIDKKELEEILKNLQNFIEICRNLSDKSTTKEKKSCSGHFSEEIADFMFILQDYIELKEEKCSLEVEIENLKDQMSKLPLNDEKNLFIQNLNSKVLDLNESFKDIYEEYDCKEDELEKYREQIQKITREKECLRQQISDLEHKLIIQLDYSENISNSEKLTGQIRGLKEQNILISERLVSKSSIITSLEGQNEISTKALLDSHKLINELQVKLEGASNHKLNEMRSQINSQVELLSSEINKKVTEISELVEDKEKLELDKISLKNQLEKERLEKNRMQNSIDYYKRLNIEYKEKYKMLLTSNNNDQKLSFFPGNELNITDDQMNKVKSELEKLKSDLGFSVDLSEKLQADLDVKYQENSKLKLELLSLESQVRSLKNIEETFMNNLVHSQSQIKAKDAEIANFASFLNEKNEKIDKLREENSCFSNFKILFEQEEKTSHDLIEKLKYELGKVKSDIGFSVDLSEKLQADLEVKYQENSKLQLEVLSLENQVLSLKSIEATFMNKLVDSQSQVKAKDDEIANFANFLNEKNEKIDKLREEISGFSNFKILFEQEEKTSHDLIEKLKYELGKVKSDLGFSVDLSEKLQADLEVKYQENSDLQLEVLSLESQLQGLINTKQNLSQEAANNEIVLNNKLDLLEKDLNKKEEQIKSLKASIEITEALNKSFQVKEVEAEKMISDLFNELGYFDGENEIFDYQPDSKNKNRICPTKGCDGTGSIHPGRIRHYTKGSCQNHVQTYPSKRDIVGSVNEKQFLDQIYDLEQKLLTETNKNLIDFSKNDHYIEENQLLALENNNLMNETGQNKRDIETLKLKLESNNFSFNELFQENESNKHKLRYLEENKSANEILLHSFQQQVISLNLEKVNLERISKNNEIVNLMQINKNLANEVIELKKKLENYTNYFKDFTHLNEKNDFLIQIKNEKIKELEDNLKFFENIPMEASSEDKLTSGYDSSHEIKNFSEERDRLLENEYWRNLNSKTIQNSSRTSPYSRIQSFRERNFEQRINNLKSKLKDDKVKKEFNEPFIGHLKSNGSANRQPCYLGPNDGIFYINSNGHKSRLSLEQKLKDLEYFN